MNNNRNDKIAHLSDNEIENLMNRYYNNEKSKDLIDEYQININPSKLYTVFPPIISEELCPYCESPMIIKRPSKSAASYQNNSAFCPICGHEDSYFCNCSNCQENRRILRLIEQERKDYQIEKKKAVIAETYNAEKYIKYKIEDLSLAQRTYLGALLRLALSENMKYIKPLVDVNASLAPSADFTNEIIRRLLRADIILVSPESPIEAFPESSDKAEFPNAYYINKVSYLLNIDLEGEPEDLIGRIINPVDIKIEEKDEAFEIWQEIALHECLEYLEYQITKVNFEFHVGEKTITTFKDLLDNYSVAQIFGIIFRGVAIATKYYQETNVTKKQAANSVISNCRKFAEKALVNKWDLTKFNRPYDIPQSMISEFFYNRITKIGDLGFDMTPSKL